MAKRRAFSGFLSSMVPLALSCFVPFVACGGSNGSNPGDGGPGPDPDGGIDGAPDAGEVPPCEGVSLTQSGSLDLDLRTARVSGAITVNGRPLPSDAAGKLIFTERFTRVTYEVSLAPSYQVTFAPGEYDIVLESSIGCNGMIPTGLPCLGGTLRERVSLTQDGRLDIDIPAITITGRVTLNGRELTDTDVSYGHLHWKNVRGKTTWFDVPTNATRTYSITLVPGTYSINLGFSSQCNDKASQFPCSGGPVKSNVALAGNGNLDLDVRSVHVTANVTLNGKALPDMGAERGYLNFGQRDSFVQFPLGRSGPLDLSLWVVPGRYSVAYQPAQSCSGQGETAFPCTTAEVLAETNVANDGVLGINIPTVNVKGAITLRGKPLNYAAKNKGQLRISTTWGGSADVDFTGAAATTYALTLVPGTYTFFYQGNPSCDASWDFPCNSGVVRSKAEISQTGAYDIDIPAVRVTGKVTLNGQPLPDETRDRGTVVLTPVGSDDPLGISLGTKDPFSFERTVLAGTYRMWFSPNSVLCTHPDLPPSPFPCAGGTLIPELALSSDGPLHLDIPTISIQGNVTLNGNVMPDSTHDRGKLNFGFVGGRDGDEQVFAAAGPASYQATLLPGRYIVRYRPYYLCDPASPFLCTEAVLKGCPSH